MRRGCSLVSPDRVHAQYFQQTRIPHRKAPELLERAAKGENIHWAFRKPPSLPPFRKEAAAMRDNILDALERIREKDRLRAAEEERLRREAKGRKRGGGGKRKPAAALPHRGAP